jgi:hypothetical protein
MTDKVQPKSAEQFVADYRQRVCAKFAIPDEGRGQVIGLGGPIMCEFMDAYAAELRVEIERLSKERDEARKDWYELHKERWKQVCASDTFQLLKHEPEYRHILELLSMGEISIGKCAEAITEVAAGCKPKLPDLDWPDDDKSWKEKFDVLEARCRELTEALRLEHARGRLFQFERMKNERPIDPIYWDMHEERELREALLADPKTSGAETKGTKQ